MVKRTVSIQPPRTKVSLRTLATGVPGLDAVLGGGLPTLSFNLIVGGPGAGKTTMAMALTFANATKARPGLFITLLGEPALKMLRYQQQYTFFDQARIGTDVHLLNLGEEALSGDLDGVLVRIGEEVARLRPGIVVIDSFRTLVPRGPVTNGDELVFDHFVQRLAQRLTTWQITSFLVAEYEEQELRNPIFTVADGVLWLMQAVDQNSVVRKLQVVKMRGMPIMPGLHTMRITDQGVQVFPRMLERVTTPRAEAGWRLSTGVPGLDQLMSGGIPSGYSVLLAGPTGSGKTTFATQFVAEGLRNGEPCVIAVFEEQPQEYIERANKLGVDFSGAIKRGDLRILYLRPLDLSVDETLDEIQSAAKAIGAQRVVIDSTSGLELALAPTFREDFRESLYRLVTTLTGRGVTVFLTVEVAEGLGRLQFTNDRVSFLSDVILLQRYIEIDGQLGKVLSIVKIRGSSHSTDFLRYDITTNGVLLRGLLRNYEGILSGAPTLVTQRLPVYPGLTEREVTVLETLIRFGKVSAKGIAESVGMAASDLAPILGRLVDLHYIIQTKGQFEPVARSPAT